MTTQLVTRRPTSLVETDSFEATLEHFGVKGMRWGVRKARQKSAETAAMPEGSKGKPAGGKPTPVEMKLKAGKKIQTRGGKNQPITQDAIYAAYLRQKAKGSGHQALTNQEMRALLDRQTLEERFSKAYPKSPTKFDLGKKYTTAFLKSPLADVALTTAVGKFGGKKSPLVQNGLKAATLILLVAKPSRAQKKKPKKDDED